MRIVHLTSENWGQVISAGSLTGLDHLFILERNWVSRCIVGLGGRTLFGFAFVVHSLVRGDSQWY
jgi:hypothetical protein